jgi:hypothetical protein
MLFRYLYYCYLSIKPETIPDVPIHTIQYVLQQHKRQRQQRENNISDSESSDNEEILERPRIEMVQNVQVIDIKYLI